MTFKHNQYFQITIENLKMSGNKFKWITLDIYELLYINGIFNIVSVYAEV